MRILITGGCGFIGSHTIKAALVRNNLERLVNLDALTYSGNPENLNDIEDERYRFVHGSINDAEELTSILIEERIEVVLHLAAESHVDRSIDSVQPFIETNIDGTRTILEVIHNLGKKGKKIHLVHVSTDEVYGSLGPNDPAFTEETPLDPRNPCYKSIF